MTQRNHDRWTEKDIETLRFDYGVFSMAVLCQKLRRTPTAIVSKATSIGLHQMQGKKTIKQIARETGYNFGAILIAARRANVGLKRVPIYHIECLDEQGRLKSIRSKRNMKFGVDVLQEERIIEELRNATNPNRIMRTKVGEWGTAGKPDCCRDCGTTERRHCSRGLCERCYKRHKSHGTLDAFPMVRRLGVQGNGTSIHRRFVGECESCLCSATLG